MKGEHGGHVGVNHSRPLGHAAQMDLTPFDFKGHRHFLGAGVGGHHGPCYVVAAVGGKLDNVDAGAYEGHGEFDADDAGAANQDFVG